MRTLESFEDNLTREVLTSPIFTLLLAMLGAVFYVVYREAGGGAVFYAIGVVAAIVVGLSLASAVGFGVAFSARSMACYIHVRRQSLRNRRHYHFHH